MNSLDISFVKRTVIDNIVIGHIDNSTIHGLGLFATRMVKEGEILCILDGQVVPKSQYETIRNSLIEHVSHPYDQYFFMEWNVLDNDTLLVRPFRTKYSYINHSRKPNLKIAKFPLRIVALTEIMQNEELTLDYREEPLSTEYMEGHGKTYL